MKKNISPHVQIYSFPITAISSITTRITGLGLTGMYTSMGISLLCNISLYDYYKKLDHYTKKVIHYTTIFPCVYHSYGGIRHFIWDGQPKYLTNKNVGRSSYFLFGSSILTTILLEKQL